MSILNQLGIVIGEGKEEALIFEDLHPNFMTLQYSSPSEFVTSYWDAFKKRGIGNDDTKSLNGNVFEYILAALFIREGILPLYISAKVAFVPNVVYDLMLYTKERDPVCISAKTSLRERYKEADLEAIALKYVHRKSLSYLITLHEKEALGVKAKIKSGDVIGLDEVIVATSKEFDDLIIKLKTMEAYEPEPFKVIESNKIITAKSVMLKPFDDVISEAQYIDCIWFKGDRYMPAIIKVCEEGSIIEAIYRLKTIKETRPSYITNYFLIASDDLEWQILSELKKPVFKNFEVKVIPISKLPEFDFSWESVIAA